MTTGGERTRKSRPKQDNEAAEAEATPTAEDKVSEVDDLLDEIDEVLETNAEDFVRSYIQKGGQ